MIKLSDYVMDFIAGLGVGHVFLLPGGGCMHLVDSLGRNSRLAPVACLHEQAAVIAADGYAQYSGNLGVALVTTGPGGANAITAVAGAWIDSTPLLVLSGQVKRQDLLAGRGVRQMGVQEVDIVSLVRPITKYAVTVLGPTEIRFHLEKAVHLARSGRPGPVWLDLPLDVQGALLDETGLAGFPHTTGAQSPSDTALSGLVAKTMELVRQSRRPVVLAGRGVRLAGANEALLQLVETLELPLLTTWRMMDLLPDDHPLFFGRPGSIASRGANFIQQNADLLLVVGARLDLPQVGFNYGHFAPAAKKLVVDIDAAEIRKTGLALDVAAPVDAKDFLAEFLRQAQGVEKVDRTSWMKRCREWRDRYPVVTPEHLAPAGKVNTYALVEALSEWLKGEDVLVPGSSGSCAEITTQAFRTKVGQRVINSPGLGSMGFGLPQAVGVCLASGGRRTVCIVGDGGLQHNIQELETVRRLQLPLKLFVLNNNGYASIRNTHNRFFEGRLVCCDPSSGLTLPDTCRVAMAYGLPAVRIEDQMDLRAEVRQVLEMEGPVICDVMVDPDLQTAPRLSSSAGPDGVMVSRPLEDLWPFLGPEELRENQIIPDLFRR